MADHTLTPEEIGALKLALARVLVEGKKTAERVVLELREKADALLPALSPAAAVASPTDDAVRALISLGYSAVVARKAAYDSERS